MAEQVQTQRGIPTRADRIGERMAGHTPWLFLAMTRRPYPFLVALPFIFILLICLGFSRDSLIEEEIANLWIPTDATYKKDQAYAHSVGANTRDEMSTFAAMALSRHGDNLFTEENLNTIVERMKLVETTKVSRIAHSESVHRCKQQLLNS